ncbi:MAG: hypothetical protein K1W23_02955 [Lachnospiraceae bacterium]
MALTQIQKLELNKRVDRIFHAPSNAPAKGHQPEIAFVADVSGGGAVYSSVRDAVASLKAHDKMFQNMRSNMVYWGSDQITSKVTPMSFILMGNAFDNAADSFADSGNVVVKRGADVDKSLHFENLCAYLKLYHARCRCILVFVDCSHEELEAQDYFITDAEAAKQQLNPFLKYRLLIIARDKMLTGSELMMGLIRAGE